MRTWVGGAPPPTQVRRPRLAAEHLELGARPKRLGRPFTHWSIRKLATTWPPTRTGGCTWGGDGYVLAAPRPGRARLPRARQQHWGRPRIRAGLPHTPRTFPVHR